MARLTTETEERLPQRPPQHQAMKTDGQQTTIPKPLIGDPEYQPAGKLKGKVVLIPATFSLQDVGKDTLMGRTGQPAELAPSDVFLATKDSSYIIGQILHPNGGSVIKS